MNSHAVTLEVAQRFHGLRRRFLLVRLIASVAISISVFAALWILLAAGDFFWEWPLAVRQSLLVASGLITSVVFGLQAFGIFSDSRQRKFVGRLEQRFESLGQRLRTVLETVDGRLKAPAAMLAALGHQTLGRWETAAPNQIIPQRTTVVAITSAFALLVIPSVGVLFQNDWRTAILRAAGQEIPYTTLHVTPGDSRLLEGTPLTLSLELEGRTKRDVTLRYRVGESETWTESELIALSPESQAEISPQESMTIRHARFIAKLGKLTDTVEYQFVTSAATTRLYRVEVQPLIEVESMQTQVTPPAYTHLEPRTFETTEVAVLAGSAVSVTIKTNHPLAKATLELGEKVSHLVPAEVQADSTATQWTFLLPTNNSLHWRFSGIGEDDTPMTAQNGRLRVRYDEMPRIEWRDPDNELKVHMLAEIPMRAQVSDDYGVTETAIVFQLGDENEFVLKQWPDDNSRLTTDAPVTQVRLEEVLPLESFALSEQDFVAYYAYAIDNREGAEQRIETEVRYLDIRPLRQFFSEQDADPLGMNGNGNPTPELDEIIRRERYLINRTRKIVRGSDTNMDQQLAMIERMVENQSELADLTRFLAEFLIFRGSDDTEALSQAEAAMLQAADSLSAADFPLALAQEEDALRALAEARRTLELILPKQMSAQQAQQMRNLRRQLRQKLRRDSKKSDQQLADTLQQIASEQMQLASEAESMIAENASNSSKIIPSDAQSNAAQPAPLETPTATGETATETPTDAPNLLTANSAASQDIEPTEKLTESAIVTRQQDLLDRLKNLSDGLSNDIKRSELVQQRVKTNVEEMDRLVSTVRGGSLTEYPVDGKELADQLRELAMHIDSLAQAEPANRISAMRDMTTSLANMEREMSAAMRTAAEMKEDSEAVRDIPRDNLQLPTDVGDDAGDIDAKLQPLRTKTERMARRLIERVDTIQDVLKTPVESGNLEAGEVNDRLQRFMDENELFNSLAASREAIERENTDKETLAWSESALQRAMEYADAASQLDNLYRQLVTPRVDQLRQLEGKAGQLAQVLSPQQGGGMQTEQKDTTKPQAANGGSAEMLRRELEQGLRSAELSELAELLNGQDAEQQADQSPEISSTLSDAAFQAVDSVNRSVNQFSPRGNAVSQENVLRVQSELRGRIQELILLEISADRNAPIPPQYRELVDRYFRSIAGERPSIQPPTPRAPHMEAIPR